VNGEVHGGRPRPTGAVVPRKKKDLFKEMGPNYFKAFTTPKYDIAVRFVYFEMT
jgi:hypothetical protein